MMEFCKRIFFYIAKMWLCCDVIPSVFLWRSRLEMMVCALCVGVCAVLCGASHSQ